MSTQGAHPKDLGHALRAHCAQAGLTPLIGRRVVVCRALYCGRVVGRVTPLRRLAVPHGRRVVGPPVVIQNYIVTQTPCRAQCAPCHSTHWSCRRPCRALTLPYRCPATRCITTQRSPPCHDIKFLLQHNSMPRALRTMLRVCWAVLQRRVARSTVVS